MTLINRLFAWLRKDFKMLVRFGVVGFSSLGVKIGVYALLSRWLWQSGSRTIENMIAIAIAIIYNYTFHRIWTFKEQQAGHESFWRYALVVVFGSSLDASLFWLGHEILGFYDLLVLPTVAVTVSLFTYFAHKFFTFKGKTNPDLVVP